MSRRLSCAMFEYKDEGFYNAWFGRLDDFSLTEPFAKGKTKSDSPGYIGFIETKKDTPHPLKIRVEIPFTFPHNKLVFFTESLYGYPHLIHRDEKESWFCLNTPFAETPEEQLNQEITRLRDWIGRQMREDLPARIEDWDVIKALRMANAYAWENTDEISEYHKDAFLTFVGDYFSKPANFPDKQGNLLCVRNQSGRFFAFPDNTGTNAQLPYVIVDERPAEIEDFMSYRKQFGWDDTLCDHLLPGFAIRGEYQLSTSSELHRNDLKTFSKEEASDILDKAVSKLIVPEAHRAIIEKVVADLRTQIESENGYSSKLVKQLKAKSKKSIDICDEEDEEAAFEAQLEAQYEEYQFNNDQLSYRYFVVGFRGAERMSWIVLYANKARREYDETTYDLGLLFRGVRRLSKINLGILLPQTIRREEYFGRGALCESLAGLNIGIVGLGAIGSHLAEALARSGARRIGLWDGDLVEPGNLCRASYFKQDMGDSKVAATAQRIRAISPFCTVKTHGAWSRTFEYGSEYNYRGGEFYGNINYNSQEKALEQLADYDVIIDCTASNELLHFLSYSVSGKLLLSLCITNHAKDLVCTTNRDGNPFELRKFYLSKLEQDTRNYFIEGTGCYSPTFLAKDFDITPLMSMVLRALDNSYRSGEKLRSTIWSYDARGILGDRLERYALPGYDISLTVSEETLLDAADMADAEAGMIGYVLGGYSQDGKNIYVTHFIGYDDAENVLRDKFASSQGLIDYIGDFAYSDESDGYHEETLTTVALKAEDRSINTKNPIVALKRTDGTIVFYLYINGGLVRFLQEGFD